MFLFQSLCLSFIFKRKELSLLRHRRRLGLDAAPFKDVPQVGLHLELQRLLHRGLLQVHAHRRQFLSKIFLNRRNKEGLVEDPAALRDPQRSLLILIIIQSYSSYTILFFLFFLL